MRNPDEKPESHDNMLLWRYLFRTSKIISKNLNDKLAPLGITFLSYRTLRYLVRQGPKTMSAISDFLLVTQGRITGIIDELESRSLVLRIRSNEDRRIINLEITDEGKSLEQKARVIYESYINSIFSRIDRENRECILNGIKHLSSVLGKQ